MDLLWECGLVRNKQFVCLGTIYLYFVQLFQLGDAPTFELRIDSIAIS